MKGTGRIKVGETVRHFKQEMVGDEQLERNPSICTYRVVAIARHTDTGEELVIYEALYSGKEIGKDFKAHDVFARPIEEFMGEVDHTKYPDIKQVYRFEVI